MQLGALLSERPKILPMQLDAPALMGGILGEHRLSYRDRSESPETCVLTHLASEDAHRVARFPECLVVPGLDR